MNRTLAIAAVAIMTLSAPAFAQSTGSPNAAPAGSGSNPPGSGVDANTPSGAMKGTNSMRANPGMSEGRAAAQGGPTGDKANDAPTTVRGDQNSQEQAK